MKKKIAIVMIGVIALMLSACGGAIEEGQVSNGADETLTEESAVVSNADAVDEQGFLGLHPNNNDGSTLEINEGADGNYVITIALFRLSSFENATGIFADNQMKFESTDQEGNPISGIIYRDSDGTFTVEFTNSTWTYIQNGDKFIGFE